MDTMDINIKRCKVCNSPLNISKDNIYAAKVENMIFHTFENYSATDCPYCGCQNLLQKRYENAEKQFDRRYKKEDMETETNAFSIFTLLLIQLATPSKPPGDHGYYYKYSGEKCKNQLYFTEGIGFHDGTNGKQVELR